MRKTTKRKMTVADGEPASGDNREPESNGPAMAVALEAIAQSGTFRPGIDAVTWQRAVRAERPMPGRAVIDESQSC